MDANSSLKNCMSLKNPEKKLTLKVMKNGCLMIDARGHQFIGHTFK